MCEAIVVCDQSYLAVVLGILEWIQLKNMSVEKNDEKEERTDYYYDAAIPNGPHRAYVVCRKFSVSRVER